MSAWLRFIGWIEKVAFEFIIIAFDNDFTTPQQKVTGNSWLKLKVKLVASISYLDGYPEVIEKLKISNRYLVLKNTVTVMYIIIYIIYVYLTFVVEIKFTASSKIKQNLAHVSRYFCH